MVGRVSRLSLVLLAPFLLVGCLLAPGKFTSSLVINADRTFTYSYVGEVYGLDLDDAMKDKDSGADGDDTPADSTKSSLQKIALQKDDSADKESEKDDAKSKAEKKAATDAKNRELAATLAKEVGYRKVEYVGDNKFLIDYQITGKLDRSFIYPYNLDAGIIVPFIAIEVRANGTVRVKAPGFANDSKDTTGGMGDLGGMGGGDAAKATSKLDGTFTLDTDAEIVSQNNEEGATTVGKRKVISWKATPLSTTAPLAVLRMAAGK
jgi:hypothetical protein